MSNRVVIVGCKIYGWRSGNRKTGQKFDLLPMNDEGEAVRATRRKFLRKW